MGVARQASAAAAGRLVLQLKAQRQDERQYQFNKCLPIAEQLKVRCFISKSDGDGPVFAGLASCVAHGSPSGQMVGADDGPKMGVRLHNCKGITKGVGTPPLNWVECGNYYSLSWYVQPKGGFTPQICKGDYDVVCTGHLWMIFS
jgi:hypothetical protein